MASWGKKLNQELGEKIKSEKINGENLIKTGGKGLKNASFLATNSKNYNGSYKYIYLPGMQGRITKVLNMKPPEILAMIEEAAGTRMYEAKKQAVSWLPILGDFFVSLISTDPDPAVVVKHYYDPEMRV